MKIVDHWFYTEYHWEPEWLKEVAEGLRARKKDVIQLVEYEDGTRKYELNPRYASKACELAEKLTEDIKREKPDIFQNPDIKVQFHRVEHITTCEIRSVETDYLYGRGVTSCGIYDTYDSTIGNALALVRAVGLDQDERFSYLEEFLANR